MRRGVFAGSCFPEHESGGHFLTFSVSQEHMVLEKLGVSDDVVQGGWQGLETVPAAAKGSSGGTVP